MSWCEKTGTCPSAWLGLLTHICSFARWLMLTSSSSLSWCGLLLLDHPSVWEVRRVTT